MIIKPVERSVEGWYDTYRVLITPTAEVLGADLHIVYTYAVSAVVTPETDPRFGLQLIEIAPAGGNGIAVYGSPALAFAGAMNWISGYESAEAEQRHINNVE